VDKSVFYRREKGDVSRGMGDDRNETYPYYNRLQKIVLRHSKIQNLNFLCKQNVKLSSEDVFRECSVILVVHGTLYFATRHFLVSIQI
jgi:hypothetical protein